jgi:hypothetical protein
LVRLAYLLALAGCDKVLGFEPIRPDAPAGPPPIDVLAIDGPPCPWPSTPTHDEDGDGTPDCVDNCPGVPGPQTDSDGDGVGDVCDPHPSLPIDRILFFDPFLDMAPNWTAVGGAWNQLSDEIEQPATTGPHVLRYDGPMVTFATVETVIEMQAGGDAGVYVATGAVSTAPDGVACYRSLSISKLEVFWRPSTTVANSQDVMPVLDPHINVRLQMSQPDSAIPESPPYCAGDGAVVSVPAGDWIGGQDGVAALYTYNASAWFLSATIYTHQ